jgi:hypothetical protein
LQKRKVIKASIRGGIKKMPFKFETNKIKLPYELHKTRKIDQKTKEIIKKEYKPYIVSYNALAKKYNVSKRLIIFIVNPEKQEKNKEISKNYYSKEKNKKYMKDYRRRKQEFYKLGKLNYKEHKEHKDL